MVLKWDKESLDASMELEKKRSAIEYQEEWREWCKKIPFIPFKAGWLVKPIPPFAGAMARFIVQLPDGRDKSVYFDAYNRLGILSEPYWEVYPVDGDTGRCMMDEVDELLKLIEAAD